jgi:hypothetical protein
MKYIATASLLALALFAATASAASPSNPPSAAKSTTGHPQQSHTDHGKMEGKTAEFAALDANKDGKLSKAELAKHKLGPHFGMLDADKNGVLSPTEFAAGKAM